MATSGLSNTAAWLMAPKARPLEIRPAPLGVPTGSQMLVKNHAIAINPIDVKIQQGVPYPVNFPAVVGQEVAGEVVAVGPDVTRFKKGDRVMGLVEGLLTRRTEDYGFQAYTVLHSNLTAHVPVAMTFEQAVVVPLNLCTAASALFGADMLNLELPTAPRKEPNGSVLLVWGGASGVGLNAIQIAVAAGYEVVTTCSPKNFDFVRRFGATHAFDYNSSSVVSDLVAAVQGRTTVGALDAVGGHAGCVEFVQRTGGVKFVATAVRGFAEPPEGIGMKQCLSLSVKNDHVGKAVLEDFLPKALEEGVYVAAPEPLVVGKGLEALQEGLDLKARGVSAQQKVVVVL